MRMGFTCFAVLLAILLCAGCGRERPPAGDDAEVAASDRHAFAVDLYGRLTAGHDQNVVFSPWSVSSALAIAYAGARGRTAGQMAAVLRFSPAADRVHAASRRRVQDMATMQDSRGCSLHSANGLWVQSGLPLTEEFLELVRTHYAGQLATADFSQPAQAAADINTWVDENTDGRVPGFVAPDSLTELTSLIIINAVHLKGEWASTFPAHATRQATFHLLTGEKTDVRMMHQTGDFRVSEQNDFRALELPYVGGDLAMIIVLPDRLDGLPALEKELTASSMSQWVSELREPEKLRVQIPRFEMRLRSDLARPLVAAGMTDAFSPKLADFSGMCEKEKLFIQRVVHEAWVRVDEQGTEAAAATRVDVAKSEEPRTLPELFAADHPFLFFIYDRHTESILFLGRVMAPGA